MADQWRVGDCFAFDVEPGDIIYGEILDVLSTETFIVRAYSAEQEGSSVEMYEDFCLTRRLTRRQLAKAARMGWPMDQKVLQTILR